MIRLIDWAMVGRNALWVVGLSTLLATYGYRRVLPRAMRERPSPWTTVGLALFALGLLLTSDRDVEKLVWAVLLAAIVLEPAISHLLKRRATNEHR